MSREELPTSTCALPPDTFTNIPDAPQNNVTNILLLDALNTRDNAVKGYLQIQMVQYLASMPPNQRIGIFVLTDNKAHLIWGFDQDSSVLRAAVARLCALNPSPATNPATGAEGDGRCDAAIGGKHKGSSNCRKCGRLEKPIEVWGRSGGERGSPFHHDERSQSHGALSCGHPGEKESVLACQPIPVFQQEWRVLRVVSRSQG